jgi:hypothetical protein
VDRPADAPTLRLVGTAIFGGWAITTEADDGGELEGASA